MPGRDAGAGPGAVSSVVWKPGTRMVELVPFPAWLTPLTSPPCASTIALTIARPSRQKRSNRRLRCSGSEQDAAVRAGGGDGVLDQGVERGLQALAIGEHLAVGVHLDLPAPRRRDHPALERPVVAKQ